MVPAKHSTVRLSSCPNALLRTGPGRSSSVHQSVPPNAVWLPVRSPPSTHQTPAPPRSAARPLLLARLPCFSHLNIYKYNAVKLRFVSSNSCYSYWQKKVEPQIMSGCLSLCTQTCLSDRSLRFPVHLPSPARPPGSARYLENVRQWFGQKNISQMCSNMNSATINFGNAVLKKTRCKYHPWIKNFVKHDLKVWTLKRITNLTK